VTTSPNQPPISQEHRHDQLPQQQQQQTGSSVAQNNLSAIDLTPKNNIEKSLQEQRYQTPRSEREMNCRGDGVVCRCSSEGDAVVLTTPQNDQIATTTTLHNCPACIIKTRVDGHNVLLTKSNQVA